MRNNMVDKPRTIFTFSAGPSMMPKSVLEQLAQDIIDYNDTGMSIAELSHRSSYYKDEIFPSTRNAFKELLNVSDDYEIIFISGGASFEFGNILRNLMKKCDLAQYINIGNWSKKAHDTAKVFENDGLVKRIESIDGLQKIDGLVAIRQILPTEINPDSAYVYITANETIAGIQYLSFPDTGKVPLVADMSSEIFTREFDMDDFGAVYACGQKNFGFAGFSVVIVRKELLGEVLAGTTDVQNYKKLAENDSAINTPPTVAVYTAGLIADYIKKMGGVKAMARDADAKSGLIYGLIDNSDNFYSNPVHPEVRSKINIPFILSNKDFEELFKKEAAIEGLFTLGGHRSVGGLRASMYIGMPYEGAEKLASFMQHFAEKYG